MTVNQILETLASNPSRNFKLDFLREHKNHVRLKETIRLALDPFIQFYIRKIPQYEQILNTDIGLSEAFDQLGYLSGRIYTGNKGIEHLRLILCNLPPESAKVIERIIKKDLMCGVSEATVNAVWPGLIPTYPCMLASAFDQKLVDKVQFPAYVQLKLDGMRFNAIVKNRQVEFRSRNGKEININSEDFAKPFIHMSNFYGCDMVFDGELLVMEGDVVLDRQTGNGILNKAVKNTQSEAEGSKVRATVWDAITLDNFKAGIDKEIYKDRFAKLANCVSDLKHQSKLGHLVNLVPNTKVDNMEEARTLFEKYLADGQEGIILKTQDMIWENKRSKKQIKFKGELECDLKVVGLEEGSGKYQGMVGALLAESTDGLVKVSVGSGLTDELRGSISQEDVVGRIITVKYNARIINKQGDHSLFLPIFLEIRSDKTEADHSKDIK